MKTIGICASPLSRGSRAAFHAVGEALGVSFQERALRGDDRSVDGWVVLAADEELTREASRAARPCYVVLNDGEPSARRTSSTITFANRSEPDPLLRGRTITADDVATIRVLPRWLTGVVPVAFMEGLPFWATQDRSQCRHHYVALPPPELDDGEALFTHFSGQRVACLLPLVLFVRSLVEERGWEPPPLHATFMFDDPNLHWTSYGFIDYAEMVTHATAGNYHVSIATIPLDGWFVHPPTSAIFRDNRSRISLLYHGNDHVSRELGRFRSAEAVRRTLNQALTRISRMERRTGLDVARVMAPPHGACSEIAISEMARLGFEALCVSRGSLRYQNPDADWTRTIGLRPCDMVAGLPIIPRFGLSKDSQNDILIAALLRQPIIPITHHQAVADGYGLLDETASFVNSLDDVAWCDMRTISRSLYFQQHDGRTLRVRMLSKCASIPVTRGATQIQVERPWLTDPAQEPLFWRTSTGDRWWRAVPQPDAIAVQPGLTIEIASGAIAAAHCEALRTRLGSPAPVARRLLTEGRDRALPSIHRIARRGRCSSCLR
jgi:hypothetical protein